MAYKNIDDLATREKTEIDADGGSFAIRGDICYCTPAGDFVTAKDGYAVSICGVSAGVFASLPEEYRDIPVEDYSGKLIIPGLVDLHIHAPQFAFRGTEMDLELMTWLEHKTFPEEARYSDLAYAERAYSVFAEAMRKGATTHALIFATKHKEATELLMRLMENTGLISYVGKVNMDREAPAALREESAERSAEDTALWIEAVLGKYKRTYPILTPRFIPCCTHELLEKLRELQERYGLPVQSHLSENQGEVDFVRMLCPESEFYGDAYDNYGLFGSDESAEHRVKTVMAHCVYSTEAEMQRIKENGVFVAHCPASNMNLSSGIAPIRKYLSMGLKMGLGSDVAGGHTDSMLRAVCDAVQVSKLYWRLIDGESKPLTFKEAFRLATLGGGEFFGKVGSLDPGYDFSAVVLDDSLLLYPEDAPIEKRLERSAYAALDSYGIKAKYINGRLTYSN